MLSPSDTAIVFLLALLLFGPEQLPKLARQLGEAMRHIQTTTHAFMQEMERAAEAAEPQVQPGAGSIPFEPPPGNEDIPAPESTPETQWGTQSAQLGEATDEKTQGQAD